MISLGLLKTELLLCALVGILFVVDIFTDKKRVLNYIAVAGSFAILVSSFFFKDTGTTFFGMFVSDGLSSFFKTLFLVNLFLISASSLNYIKKEQRFPGEYFILLVSATLGMALLASSQEMITFYISLELLSISSYILASYERTSARSTEAGMKYLLLGAMASGILLFGISLVYGATGTLHFQEIARSAVLQDPPAILTLGLVLILAALSFKIAVVPFHMWVPDVYEGAPTPVAAFFSVATKMAGFALVIRLFTGPFGALTPKWGALMAMISAVTMIVGNLLAIPQTNIKRFMGYSGIAQAGYIIMGIAMASGKGLGSAVFYLVAYLFSNLAAFIVIIIFSAKTGDDTIEAYRGLSRRSPGLAFALLIALMSLGGVPPLAGFLGKLYIFSAAVEQGYMWLVVLGVLMSVVSIYYYLMILKRAYIDAPVDASPISFSALEKFAITVSVAGTIIFGVYPQPLFDKIITIVQPFLK
ncbi:MAG: NADH-quinone oxidoreductase subunit N [Candidatus Omnitrophica bacterium]|nr:NADH-quinone oxidoreductase subunit N [Candidatus Omnitrophota bacterium]